MKIKLSIVLLIVISLAAPSALAQNGLPIPVMPDCSEFAEVEPAVLIGGNTTISLGGLELYQSYIEQHSDEHTLSLNGDQMLGEDLVLEGCFVDEYEFWLFGTKGNLDVIFIGVAVEPDYSEPTYGGLWFGWSKGYDPEVAPDQKGFFFKLL